MIKKNIAVFMGGWSSERDISMRSGISVYNNLDSSKYNKCIFHILKDKKIQVTLENIEVTEETLKEVPAINLNQAILMLLNWKIEAAFLVMHGAGGEDGVLQGFLEMLEIPYTHSDICGSAIAMDKEFSKYVYIANQIPTPRYFILEKNSDIKAAFEKSKFKLPVISKPVSQGSSVGVYKCHDINELIKNANLTFEFSQQILVEEYVKHREFTCAVIDINNETKPLAVTEIITTTDFFDFNAKYYDNKTKEIVPADISEELSKEIQALAIRAHQALKCSGTSRTDILQDANGKLYVIETNTIPGMTEQSLLPKAAKISEYGFSGLLDILIDNAISRKKHDY